MATNPLCHNEAEKRGDIGPVESLERVGRLVTSPNHFRKNGALKPGAFPLSHIRATGVSLFRVDHMAEDQITSISNAIAGRIDGETPVGVLVVSVANVRAIQDVSGYQALCVLEDPVKDMPPYPDNPAHAIAISSKDRSDEEILEIQSDLHSLFEDKLRKLGAVKSGHHSSALSDH